MTGAFEPWWKTGVVYQIYPRSFQDSNGDGIGDLPGIMQRLPYLSGLGIDALWISPFYPSPMADFGYDVADYVGVDPRFGTLEDFDALLAKAHALGLKVILDLVPNHSSNLHPWFLDARSTRASAKRDWYIWKDGAAGGGPPNNWLSLFGGSAWTFDPLTEQYYYHAFLKEQPDLNWANPALRAAMYDVMRFWLARGIDGFRVDVIWHLAKDQGFLDEPQNSNWTLGEDPYFRLNHIYSCDQPAVHGIIAEMRRLIDERPDRVLIGETYLPLERLALYYGDHGQGAHLPFNFHLLTTPWEPRAIAKLIIDYEQAIGPDAWPNWVMGNHDRKRIATRIGVENVRLAAMLILTLRGTPTLYYGDELGLSDVAIPHELVQDPWEKNVPGIGLGRDPVRTPMPWAESAHGGFSSGAPWLPLNPDYTSRNVSVQRDDTRSVLNLYRNLLQLRRAEPALNRGSFTLLSVNETHLVYERGAAQSRIAVALNFSASSITAALPTSGRVLLDTRLDRKNEFVGSSITLRPHEGIIVRL